MMSGDLATFTSRQGEQEFIAVYDALLNRLPVPYEELDIPTRFGTTNVIASGPASSPPLLLLHATGTSAMLWMNNIGPLSSTFRVFAVDIIGEPGKTRQTRLFENHKDCADWLSDVIDGMGLRKPDIAGLSYGGWHTLNFSMHHPDKVNRIAVLAPGASVLPFSWWVLAMLRVLPYIPIKPNPLNRFFASGICPDEQFARLFALGVRHFRYPNPRKSIFTNVFSGRELRNISTPTLFLAGAQEVIYDPKAAIARVLQLIPGATTALIPDAGHLVAMEQPALVNEHLLKFFR